MSEKNQMQIVCALERGTGENKKTWWTRVGTSFENKDGSWNLKLDFLPIDLTNATLQMRRIEPKAPKP